MSLTGEPFSTHIEDLKNTIDSDDKISISKIEENNFIINRSLRMAIFIPSYNFTVTNATQAIAKYSVGLINSKQLLGNVYNTVLSSAKTIGYVAWLVYKSGYKYSWGPEDNWKDQRYIVGIKQNLKFFWDQLHFDFTRLKLSEDKITQDIGKHLEKAAEVLESNKNIREIRGLFYKSLDSALKLILLPTCVIDKEIQLKVFEFCKLSMTDVNLQGIGTKSLLYVASNGNPGAYNEIKKPSVSLSHKFKLLLNGITNAGIQLKCPLQDRNAAKLAVITDEFSPLRSTNMSNQIAKTIYKDAKGQEIKTLHFRTGVPVCFKDSNIKKDQPWDYENENITLLPTYIGFLKFLAIKKERLLIILHLDPYYYNTKLNDISQPPNTILRMLHKYREAMWIKMNVDLSKHDDFKDILFIAIIPVDGEWIEKEIFNCKCPELNNLISRKTIDELISYLKAILKDDNSPYLIPFISYEILDKIFYRLKNDYFWPFALEDKLTPEQMLAFKCLFDDYLAEALLIYLKANYLQRNCKDGVDRTMVEIGVECAEKLMRQDRWNNLQDQEDLLGAVLSPALGVMKREILGERQPVLLATLRYLEWLQLPEQQAKKPKDYIRESVCDYQLDDMQFNEGFQQALYAPAAEAPSVTEYKQRLYVESHYPFAVPSKMSIKNSNTLVDQLFQEPLEWLQTRYQKFNYKVIDNNEPVLVNEDEKGNKIYAKTFVLYQENYNKAQGGFTVLINQEFAPYSNNYQYKFNYQIKIQDNW